MFFPLVIFVLLHCSENRSLVPRIHAEDVRFAASFESLRSERKVAKALPDFPEHGDITIYLVTKDELKEVRGCCCCRCCAALDPCSRFCGILCACCFLCVAIFRIPFGICFVRFADILAFFPCLGLLLLLLASFSPLPVCCQVPEDDYGVFNSKFCYVVVFRYVQQIGLTTPWVVYVWVGRECRKQHLIAWQRDLCPRMVDTIQAQMGVRPYVITVPQACLPRLSACSCALWHGTCLRVQFLV